MGHDGTSEHRCILLVGDDDRLLEARRAALGRAGFRVTTATSCEDAFAALLDLVDCACIVLDVRPSSGLTPTDFLDRARSYLRFCEIPVVVVGTEHAPGPRKAVAATVADGAPPDDVVAAVQRATRG